MNRMLREIRLIPLVLLGMLSLFVLKTSGLIFNGGYTLAERLAPHGQNEMKIVSADSVPISPKIVIGEKDSRANPPRKRSWAQEMFNYGGENKEEVTGSIDNDKKPFEPPLKTSNTPPPSPTLELGNTSIPIEPGHIISPGENAVIERLQERRRELDNRSHELDVRENLIKAAEKRLEAKLGELNAVETRLKESVAKRDKAEADRLKTVVSMYENMKPKDAARIFDRLNLDVLIEISTSMKSRTMSEVLAQMSPEAAEKLTVELANRARAQKVQTMDQLPKIEGKPRTP